ncbi:uncharacterized protein LOC106462313 [Limulus polyphemus]|uniref:Uncharacterized protein LOC106462313 n=1 Tax=Limulus polyphemus TaxID=6850 RepID=A0ABM1B9Q4_LIMPO|nr:uncharacterized protein LOC106462313 [Limulus polyphemus]
MGTAPLWAVLPPLLMILSQTSGLDSQDASDLRRTRNDLSPQVRQHQLDRKKTLSFLRPRQPKYILDQWPLSAVDHRQQKKLKHRMFVRQRRGSHQYDVPQIECPPAEDGTDRFACPTPDRMSRYRCIDDHELCDGFIDCPQGEDEDRQACMFYKTTKVHLDVLADALLRWARGRY